jgi:hypothetical protein
MSPGSAPAIATGPVKICGPNLGGFAWWIACNAEGIRKPEPAVGITSGAPETHSRITVSPSEIVKIGWYAALNVPQWIVSGVAAT